MDDYDFNSLFDKLVEDEDPLELPRPGTNLNQTIKSSEGN